MRAVKKASEGSARTLNVRESRRALDATRTLRRLLDENPATLLTVTIDGESVMAPRRAVELFADVLDDLGEGDDVTIAPYDVLVGTSVAADLLNVSTTWVTRLADCGELDATMIGTKRRCRLGGVIARRRAQAAARRADVSWEFPEPAE